MNDAEYADRAEDGVISSGQNETSSWEVTYDPDFTDRVFEAVNYMSDVQDSVDHYRMHLRHYQQEVRDLKSEIESLKIKLRGSQDRAQMILRAKNEWADRARKSFEEIQERQARDEIDPLVKSREPYGKVPVSYIPPGIIEFKPLADITREWSPRSHYEDKE